MKQEGIDGDPVYSEYFADPFVWRSGNEYFAVGTGESEAGGHPSGQLFPLLHSSDFQHWEPAGHALIRPEAKLGDTFWAPEVAFTGERFFLYYSVGFADRQHQLRVAVSETPLGPYQDVGHPLLNPAECPFA